MSNAGSIECRYGRRDADEARQGACAGRRETSPACGPSEHRPSRHPSAEGIEVRFLIRPGARPLREDELDGDMRLKEFSIRPDGSTRIHLARRPIKDPETLRALAEFSEACMPPAMRALRENPNPEQEIE